MPLSAKQMEYLALAWQCFESEPKIDYAKFATVAGLASAASARELMRVTKNKLKVEYGALSSTLQTSDGNTTPQPRTPKTPARKIAAAAASSAATTPISSRKKRGRKAVADEIRHEVNGDGDGEGGNGNATTGDEDGRREDGAASAPVAKKARGNATPAGTAADAAATAGVKVKSEFGLEDGVGEEEEVLAEEVSIF